MLSMTNQLCIQNAILDFNISSLIYKFWYDRYSKQKCIDQNNTDYIDDFKYE